MYLLSFYVELPALGDRNADVRKSMLNAAIALIDEAGLKHFGEIISYLDEKLELIVDDQVKEGAVILYGRIARHLPFSDNRISDVIEKLIVVLDTPSESVQTSAADCLYPLLRNRDLVTIVDKFITKLISPQNYAQQKGAAYGIASVVKANGLSKSKPLIAQLRDLFDEKNAIKKRAALFAFDHLTQLLGKSMEPYLVYLLPTLITTYGDSKPDIREATNECARQLMMAITSHGVKVTLPILLKGLEERNWRAKEGALQLIGQMAYCAPRQLSICLPVVIPELVDALADSHQNVRATATTAIKNFGDIIQNPEVRTLVPVLVSALRDPHMKTEIALGKLLSTAFVHIIDAPSLALIFPIARRGLKERNSDVKRKAAQIVGSLAVLSLKEDLVHYEVIDDLKLALFDAVPDTRATSARTISVLVGKLGENSYPRLMNELKAKLQSESAVADRQGAAQAISEILAVLSEERLDSILFDIDHNSMSAKVSVREGYISLLIYLPSTFGSRFQPYIRRIISPLLQGLADDSEYVREASLRAGQIIINNFASSAIDLLMPELEKGLFDDSWRIRHSSIQLLGTLLFKITGTDDRSKATINENDEEINSDQEDIEEEKEEEGDVLYTDADRRKKLVQQLGESRAYMLLASLYVVRLDESSNVRQSAIHIWKALVHNTPKTLREVLPQIIELIIRKLAIPGTQLHNIGTRTLSDIVRKLGERIIRRIIPLLTEDLQSEKETTRYGATLCLSEVLRSAASSSLEEYFDQMIELSTSTLCDSSALIRSAGTQVFDALYQTCSLKAVEALLPSLLSKYRDSGSLDICSSIVDVATLRPPAVLPIIYDNLYGETSMSDYDAQLLSKLVEISRNQFGRFFHSLMRLILNSLYADQNSSKHYLNDVVESVHSITMEDDEESFDEVFEYLDSAVHSKELPLQVGALRFCEHIKPFTLSWSKAAEDFLRSTFRLLPGDNEDIRISALNALKNLCLAFDKDDWSKLTVSLQQGLQTSLRKSTPLSAFSDPKVIGFHQLIF